MLRDARATAGPRRTNARAARTALLAALVPCCALLPALASGATPLDDDPIARRDRSAAAGVALPTDPASPTGFWSLDSSTGTCDGLEAAAPEAHFTADGRYSFASRSYVPSGTGPDAGCCSVRWGRNGLWRADGHGLQLDALSIPVEVRARAPVEAAALRPDGRLEVRVPESSCTLAFVRSAGTPDWRHAQTRERLRQCVQVQVTKPGAGPAVAWGDSVQIEMRVRSPAVLASPRGERSTVEPGSHATWQTIEYALVGHAVGARLRVSACPELTLAGVPPQEMPTEPIVAEVRILARATGAAAREPGANAPSR